MKKLLLLILTLVLLPSSALAILGGGGGSITGSVDGSQISADRAWISPSGTSISFVDGYFELRYPLPEETLYLGGTILDSHLDLGTYHPLLTTYEGSVLSVDLDLDYIEPTASTLFDRFSTLTITFTYPSGSLILIGGGFLAQPGYLNITPTNPVPEPATLLLLGTGLAGAGIFGRKRLARKQS